MATAGASMLAGRCGLSILTAPLLGLAILQALWIPGAGMWRHRASPRLVWREWWTVGRAHEHTGVHTVPLGLAVTASGLAGLSTNAVVPWTGVLADICLGLTWVLTVVCVGRFIWSLAFRKSALQMLDGTWFLVPAALLGAAIATRQVAGLAAESDRGLVVLALSAALLGWLGYWAVAWAALARVWRFRLGGVPQAPWWIAMGCAGLAAAALGRVMSAVASQPPWQAFLITATTVTSIVAAILCVPVLFYSATFLLHRCRFRSSAPWPPTFSTAVFALGFLVAGDTLRSPEFRILGLAAAYATLILWAFTMLWNTARLCVRHLLRNARAP